MKENKIDIKTVLFCKMDLGKTEVYNYFSRKDFSGFYLTIGNYDAMAIYSLEKYNSLFPDYKATDSFEDVFSMMLQEKKTLTQNYGKESIFYNENSMFFHPIHVAKHYSEDDEEKKINAFWENKNSNLVVTFLYSDIQKDLKELEETLTFQIDQFKEKEVEYQIYRSFNMSRLVIFWKSNRLISILNGIEKMKSVIANSHTHTICGFMYTKEIDNSIVDEKDELPLIKITGTIKSHKEAYDYIRQTQRILFEGKENADEIKEVPFFLALGSNDFNAFYKNIKTSALKELLNLWIQDENVCKAFSNVKTRVHVTYSDTSLPIINSVVNPIPFDKCFVEYYANILKLYKEDWTLPLIETINLLYDMHRKPALSQIIYFTFDSLNVLLESLRYIYEKYDTSTLQYIMDDNRRDLNRYVRGLNSLICQLTRLDGYLSQEPGNNPLVYDMIPAGILEYYYSYIRYVVKTVKEATLDTYNDAECSILLIPTLARNIKIDNVLYCEPKGENPIYPPYQVYLVEIPYRMLYKPEALLFAVTHEIMHFCGESIRCRKERYDAVLSFVADAFVEELGLECQDASTGNYVYQLLRKRIDKKEYGQYLDVLEKKLSNVLLYLYKDVKTKNELFAIYSSQNEDYSRHEIINKINSASHNQCLLQGLSDAISLFRECYADLAVIRLLHISEEDYLKIIIDEVLKTPDDNDQNVRFALFEQRIALVMYAIRFDSQNFDFDFSLFENEKARRILNSTKELITFVAKMVNNEDDEEDYDWNENYYCGRSLAAIAQYLTGCDFEIKNGEIDSANITRRYLVAKKDAELLGDEYWNLIVSERRYLIKKMQQSKALLENNNKR